MLTSNRFFRTTLILGAGLSLLCLQGCASYRLGSQLPDDIQTTYVPLVINETDEPLLETAVQQAVIQELVKDGSLKPINDEARADSILNVTVTLYKVKAIAFTDQNRNRPDEYRLEMRADIELLAPDGTPMVRQSGARGRSTFVLTVDMTTSKREATPEAARDLANDIVAKVTESWAHPAPAVP